MVSRSMRVLRLCSVFEPPEQCLHGPAARFDPVGGMQTHTGELTRALDQLGVAQLVVTTRPPGAPSRGRLGQHGTVLRVGLPVPVCRQFYAWPAARVLARRAAGADLLHAHLGEDLAVAPIALAVARRRRLPLVLTVHSSVRQTLTVAGPRSALLKVLGGAGELRAQRRADAVVALTPRLAGRLVDAGVPAQRVHVIPSGLRPGLFDADDHAPDPLAGLPHPRVLFIGRLHRQKGVDVLLRATALLPGARLVIAGDGPQRAVLGRLADRLGISHRVRFLGFVPHEQVPPLLRAADVLAAPSRYEELGTVLVEGAGAGVPIVASRTGGIPEVLTDGVHAALVPPGDIGTLASTLHRVLTDRTWAGQLAARARQRAGDYSWDVLAGRVLAVYRQVLTGSRDVPETTRGSRA